MSMVRSYGYPVESYEVQTEDGYILDMFRIPPRQQANKKIQHSITNAVFLMHGMLTNSESFIYGGPSESIALRLADLGYDVFVGNARGTIYGQRHTKLNPKKDAAFWRFCWHEIGMKDLPAMMSKALSVSGQDKLIHIGHNEGTTSFYVLASEMPQMVASKVERHISLGPMVFLGNSTNEILLSIEAHAKQRSWVIKNLGANTFNPTEELINSAEMNCMQTMNDETMCKNVYFLLNGYNSRHLNQTTMKQVMPRVPSTMSVREILHLVQLKTTGRFETFSDAGEAREYDLSKVTVPVALLYSTSDNLCTSSDLQTLKQRLPNVYWKCDVEYAYNNLDMLYSEYMDRAVLVNILLALQRDTKASSEENRSV
ncbi:hypothetical protein NQ315_007599 [Exocentrus adspersus]|uniref:Lipase n=1 Tax=Exocentrus adspersus TaxID=1586481 RepID=A0AAV8W7S6_9CUCU|nr:hypothetical protein NQ315_007599 [Exocentrus adspersus]